MAYRILAFNPGATSTKVGYFEDEDCLYKSNVVHGTEELAQYNEPNDQLPLRYGAIFAELERAGIDPAECDAYSGRGGSQAPCEGGTYFVNDRMMADFRKSHIKHAANLGAQLAYELSQKYDKPAFTVSPPDADELWDLSRLTGIDGVYREAHCHMLNQKEVAHRYAASIGKNYEDLNLVVCHLGGGTSVSAHRKGKVVDSTDTMQGDGPFCPSRSGTIPGYGLIKLCFDERHSESDVRKLVGRAGGWLSLLGTADAKEVKRRIAEGDGYAGLCFDTLIYQHAKAIGSFVAAMKGKTDAILLTGGIVNDEYVVEEMKAYVEALAPVVVLPGEFELEALAAGALRHLRGEEPAREYTGEPYWKGFGELRKTIKAN
jgi:butyrate kinase